MSYRKHSVSKGARQAHHKREKSRRRKLREKGGQIEPFGYVDTRGCDKKTMRRLSVTKGQRDGAPRLMTQRGAGDLLEAAFELPADVGGGEGAHGPRLLGAVEMARRWP